MSDSAEQKLTNSLHSHSSEAVPQNRSGSFWVIEQFTDGQSQGYWSGGSSRCFTKSIDDAMQFCRQIDAQRAIWGWHWRDVKVTEHLYIQSASEDAGQQREPEIMRAPTSLGPAVEPLTHASATEVDRG